MNIGDTIDGKYLIVEEIGEGGMGKVFKVQQGDNLFALKVCLDKDEESIKRFRREVRLMASIKHDNVIEVLAENLDGVIPYFVMPLCKFSIDKKLEKLQANQELAIDILLQVCNGINAIHLSGIIHRDIKPKNILISTDNKVKMSDLGLGKFKDRDSTILTSSNVYMGTQGFIPPEFFKSGGTKNANVKSDIYQLGKTIYNVFTNRNPTLIEKDILPGGLLYIIQKCIADNPENRYKSVGELENALNNYLLSLKPQANPTNAYENLINIAKDNLKVNQYDKDNVEDIVKTLFNFNDDPETFFKKFNDIPKQILEIIAANFPALCNDLIDVYSTTTEKYFRESRIDFSEAELVANAMNRVFKGSKDLETKIKAMRMTLFASVYCNRYNAMEVFDLMLQETKNDQDAVAVVEMLKDNLDSYEYIADRVPSTKLHPLIQALQLEIKQRKEEENAKRNADMADW
ncbi:serine/threonine-protein kinase [Lunatimonas salinarum]|uniref:serine/threonine-protein kinase n=1 Tax=Lunatimonas salinarum TaxID=1774590 RepID=UPI001ADF06D5|nr:serine/threonine-protein kinase [Lunatimonas salinarum]